MAAYTVSGGWRSVSRIGLNQPIDVTSTVKLHTLGDTVRCKDTASTDYGYGEFIYLSGVASTVAGSSVLITAGYGTTLSAARDKGGIAVACSANAATTSYGWYQTKGKAVCAVGTCDINSPLYLGASGVLDTTEAVGDCVYGARSVTAADTATAVVNFGRSAACNDGNNA
jgi:hypothetical protein